MSAAERARELLAGITPGKWEAEPWEGTARESVNVLAGSLWGPRVAGLVGRNSDAEFIAAAPDLVRDLLAELDQARGLLRDARRHEMVYRNEKWSDEVPPGGVVCNECEEPVETEPCYLHGAGMDVANSLRTRIFDVLAERDAALATLAEVRELHSPHDGEWCCGDESPDCETCASGGSHEGQVCTLCTHEDWEEGVVTWPCHTVRLIDAALDRGPR